MPTAPPTPPDLHRLEDSELLRRYVERGSGRAFTLLFERWHTRLLNFINQRISSRETAEDLAMEVWTKVHLHAHRFEWDKTFSTWVYTIASNLIENETRNQSRSPIVLFKTLRAKWRSDKGDRPLEWPDFSHSPDKEARRRQLREDVEEAVAELKSQHRVVFVLREFAD